MRKLDPLAETVMLSAKIPAPEMARLNDLASRLGRPRSDVVRLAIAFAREHGDVVFPELMSEEVLTQAS
jgi:predicted DNA-binding protein